MKLGPIKADLGLSEGRLKLLVCVADEQARELLLGAIPSYVEALSSRGIAVEATVGLAPREELSAPGAINEIQYLCEHHLLDESA